MIGLETKDIEITAYVSKVSKEVTRVEDQQYIPIEDAIVTIKGKSGTIDEGLHITRSTFSSGYIEPIEFQYNDDAHVTIEVETTINGNVHTARTIGIITKDGMSIYVTFMDDEECTEECNEHNSTLWISNRSKLDATKERVEHNVADETECPEVQQEIDSYLHSHKGSGIFRTKEDAEVDARKYISKNNIDCL